MTVNDWPDYDEIAVTQHEAVLEIALNRPERLNPISARVGGTRDQILDALGLAETSDSIGSVLLTGAGDAFLGALLSELTRGGVHRSDLAGLTASPLQNLVSFAAWAGAQAVTALGATTGMVRAERPSLAPELS